MLPLYQYDGYEEPKEKGQNPTTREVKVLQALLGFSDINSM